MARPFILVQIEALPPCPLSDSSMETTSPAPIGDLLRQWRTHRSLSQMALAFAADLSPRHVSFIETGRAQPSRASLLALAEALDVPLRERNVLLEAAGFARAYSDAPLTAPELAFHRRLVSTVLARHDPFFAVAIDRHWNVRLHNEAGGRVLARFFGPHAIPESDPPNLARLLFHPAGLRPCILNWPAVGAHFAARLHRERLRNPHDAGLQALYDELHAYGDLHTPEAISTHAAHHVLPIELDLDGTHLRLLGSILAFEGATTAALDELRIETFFPADEETARRLEWRTSTDMR